MCLSGKMGTIIVLATVMFGLCSLSHAEQSCPCSNPDWCKPIEKHYKKEIFIFSLSDKNWHLYDWDKITSIVLFSGSSQDEIMCFAHSKQVRVIAVANYPTANLTNAAERSRWVQQQLDSVAERHLDGVNVDYEDAIPQDRKDLRDGLTALMTELTQAMKKNNSNYQVTFDVAWSPNCIDQRCYDYKALADITDFLFVMSYDERSQIYGPCVAWANCGLNNTFQGLHNYTKMGISNKKLVLGIPWYGYNYPCIKYDKTSHVCTIKKVPFRGVECSDAAGSQKNYGDIINNYLNKSTTGLMWDKDAASPYFTYYDQNQTVYQIWFDNPKSLKDKYDLAHLTDLRGVGMWNADALDYSNTSAGEQQRKEMWGLLPDYKTQSDLPPNTKESHGPTYQPLTDYYQILKLIKSDKLQYKLKVSSNLGSNDVINDAKTVRSFKRENTLG